MRGVLDDAPLADEQGTVRCAEMTAAVVEPVHDQCSMRLLNEEEPLDEAEEIVVKRDLGGPACRSGVRREQLGVG